MAYIALLVYMAVALALQLLSGDFPVAFFAFPLDLIMAVLWIRGACWLWDRQRKSAFVTFMLSKGATVTAVSLFLVFSLAIGLTGLRAIADTWVFVAFMLYFQTVLLFVLLRGWKSRPAAAGKPGSIRWRFLLNHAGLLIALSSAFWGAPDSETLRMQVFRDVPTREAFRTDGTSAWLSYEVRLDEFKVDTYENGVPSMYEAQVEIDEAPVTLRVNHPYAKGFGENVYLSGYDSKAGGDSEYCIIQIVREPWKHAAAAGIMMMFAGALLLFVSGPRKRTEE